MIKKNYIWSILSVVTPYILQFITFIILARLLEKKDFGIVSMAMVVIGIAQIFKDAGLGQALIQSKKDVTNFVFSIQFIIGIFLFIILVYFSDKIAILYGELKVSNVIKVLSILFLIYPFIDIPIYKNIKELNFKVVFFRNTIGPLLLGIISIGLAINNYGYWSLVIGQIISNFVTAIYFFSVYKLKFDFNYKNYLDEFKFSMHIFIQGVIGWINNSLDKTIIGASLGKTQLGEFEVARRSSGIIYKFISTPINQLMYPIFSKLYNDGKKDEIVNSYFLLIKRISIISIPLGVFIIINSHYLIILLLGEKWSNIVFVFDMLMIGIINATIVTINQEIYKALNRVEVLTKFLFFRTFIVIPIYLYTANISIEAVALGRAMIALFIGSINIYILSKVLNIKYSDILKLLIKPVSIAIILAIISYIISNFTDGLYQFLINSIIFSIIFFMSIKIYEPELLQWRNI